MNRAAWMMVVLMAAASACNQPSETGTDATDNGPAVEQSTEQRQVEIKALEDELYASANLRSEVAQAKAKILVGKYRDYVSTNPLDSLSPEYLFRAADLSIGLGKPEAAIRFLDRITIDFPNYEKVVAIYLFKGFVYENHMNSHANAIKAYEQLIEKYPNHRLAEEARAAIDNLRLSEEELLEKLKQQAAT